MRSTRPLSFRQQMQMSMNDLASIVTRGQSPTADDRFTVRTIDVIEPALHDAADVQQIRNSLKCSQALFARILGVSVALVRAWELGTRYPSPLARRLLDQVRANPRAFTALIRSNDAPRRSRRRKVA